jgi:uncharacterized protein (TIRG00374 family)
METVEVAGTKQRGGTAQRAASGRWVSYLLLAFGVAILAAFAATTNFHQIGEALARISLPVLGLALAAMIVQIVMKAMRWRFMVQRLTGTRISLRFGTISVLTGVAAGSVTPARSFEVAKAMMLKGSYEVPLSVSTSAMIVERMLDIAFVVVAFLLAAAFVPRRMVLASHALVLTIAALVLICVLIAALPQRVSAWAASLLRWLPLPADIRGRALRLQETFFASLLVLRQQHTLGALVLLTAVITALDVMRVTAVFRAMDVHLGVSLVIFTYLGAAMLGMALLIPGGVGVTEVSMAGLIAFLAPGAVMPDLARSAVLIDRFLSYYLLVLIGAGLLIAYHRLRHVFV